MGNPLISTDVDDAVAAILLRSFEESSMTLRGLSRASGVKLTRLGDVLRRGKAMTIGEIDLIASALGLIPWQVMREAEQSLDEQKATVLEMPTTQTAQEEAADELPDFTQLAARTVTRRPGWDASQAGTDAGEEPQD